MIDELSKPECVDEIVKGVLAIQKKQAAERKKHSEKSAFLYGNPPAAFGGIGGVRRAFCEQAPIGL